MRTHLRAILRPVLSIALALVAALAPTPAAHAQASQMVGQPLTTKRLERLLRVYVAPTEDEAAAIDRLHEAYLDRFRAELDPEIAATGRNMSTRMPSREEFEKFMRDVDRLQAKIAEADGAFLDSATNLVAEPRRAGMQRIREARERQRLLSGLARMAPIMFGGGGSFVDLADLLARDEYVRQVPEGAREQFDALLRSQEQRTLAQGRTFAETLRRSMAGMFDIMQDAQGADIAEPAEGADAEANAAAAKASMERVQRTMQRMRELGESSRKAIAANLDSNRAAVRQFATVLPERTFHTLRREVAKRSMGAMSAIGVMARGFESDVPMVAGYDPGTVIARLRRDDEVAPETRALLDQIDVAWRRESADATEQIAEIAIGLDQSALFGGVDGETLMNDGPMARIREVQAKSDAADQRAYRAIRDAIGGEKSEKFLATRRSRRVGDDGVVIQGDEMLMPKPGQPEVEESMADASDDLSFGYGIVYDAPNPLSAQDIARLLRDVGVAESSLPVIEGVVDAWRAKEWDAKVAPLGKALSETSADIYGERADGTFGWDREKQAKGNALRRQIADAVFAADRALCADLAGTLGFEPDGPETLLLRLERIALLNAAWMVGSSSRPVSPSQVLARAKVPAEVGRAFLANAGAEWKALADELPALANGMLERQGRMESLQADADRTSSPNGFRQLFAENNKAARDLATRLASVYDAAGAKATEDAALRNTLKRARLAAARPDIYLASECASAQLASALRLEGLTGDQRSRLEALQAEYDAVYEMLSEKLASDGYDAMMGDMTEESARTMQERMEALEKTRFQRKERTDKARSEARRILGDELAARVRGLVPEEGARSQTNRGYGFNPFGDDED